MSSISTNYSTKYVEDTINEDRQKQLIKMK